MKKYHFLTLLVSLWCEQLNAADISWSSRIQEAAQYAEVPVPHLTTTKEALGFIGDCLRDLINQYATARCEGMSEVGRDGAPNAKRESAFVKAQHAALDKFLRDGLTALQQAINDAQQAAERRVLALLEDLKISP